MTTEKIETTLGRGMATGLFTKFDSENPLLTLANDILLKLSLRKNIYYQ